MPESCPRCRFWRGLLNLYGLFYDCSPFLHKQFDRNKSLLETLRDKQILSVDDYDTITSFIHLVNALRNIYCHNATSNDYTNQQLNDRAMDFFDIAYYDQLSQLTMPEKAWENYMENLRYSAAHAFDLLDQAIVRLAASQEKGPTAIFWLDCIMHWYKSQKIYLNSAILEYYEYTMLQKGRNPPYSDAERQMYTNQLWKQCGLWEAEIQKNAQASKVPVLPYELFMDYVQNKARRP